MIGGYEKSRFFTGVGALFLLWVFCLAPVVAAFWPLAAAGSGALGAVLREPRQWRLFLTTAAVAFGAAGVATVLGAPAGYALGRMPARGRRVLGVLLAGPLVIPPYITAVAWVDALGRAGLLRRLLTGWDGAPTLVRPYGVAATIFVLALSYFPIVAFAVLLGVRRLDGRWEEAALLAASRARVFRAVVAPLVLPYAALGGGAVFFLALLSFSVPLLLQTPVYTVEIYTRFTSLYEPAQAVAHALPLAVFLLPLPFLWRWGARRRNAFAAGGAGRPALEGGAGAAVWGGAWCVALAVVATGVPLAVLASRAWPPDSFVEVWQTARSEILTSLLLAGVTATLGVGLGFLTARSFGAAGSLAALPVSLLPFLFSGPVLGLGLIRLWNRAGVPGAVYDSFAILVIASLGRYYVFAYGGARSVLGRLHPRLEESAAVHGAGFFRRSGGIIFPAAAPALAALWGLLFVLSMGELDTAVLVSPPGWTPLPVRIFTLMHYGPSRLVAALSLTAAAFILAGAGFAAFAYSRARKVFIGST